MGTDAHQIAIQEGAYTYRSKRLSELLLEQDARTTGANSFSTFTRNVAGLITKVEYFTDVGRTLLDSECIYTYATGTDGVEYIATITAIFYEVDGTTEDGRVTKTMTRDLTTNDILSCNSPFTTAESEKL